VTRSGDLAPGSGSPDQRRPLRVLILHSRYLSGPASGENRVAEEEARLLREAGHLVTKWTPSPDPGDGMGLVRAGLSAVWSPSAFKEVRRLVRRSRPDVVHVHNLYPMLSPAVLRIAESEGAAVVVTLHNYRLMCLPANFLRDGRTCELCLGKAPWRGVVYRCYRDSALGSAAMATSLVLHRGLGSFDRVRRFLAVSEFVRQKHIEAGVSPGRIRVKRNFAWAAPRRQGPGEYFLYLGRLAPEKGAETLLRVAGDLSHRLVVVGEGPQGEILRRGAPPTVEFMGSVTPEEVPAILSRARALLVPSLWYEAAPRGILESYASGVPVVASRIGALPEVVEEGVTGVLAEPGSAESWRRVLSRLAEDQESGRLGEGAFRAWSERYTPEHGIRDLEAAYREAMGDGDHPGARNRG
jgi:glycosyltransferase involved in cell wall biosynthesis